MTQKWLNYEGIFLAELQVRLKKLSMVKKFFLVTYFQNETFKYFWFITCKVKQFNKNLF